MKKLKLEIDRLQVQTFEASVAVREQGSVQAHGHTAGGGYTCIRVAECMSDYSDTTTASATGGTLTTF